MTSVTKTRTLRLDVQDAKHVMWKATKHHRKTRPIKRIAYQRHRTPPVREPLPPPPPQVIVIKEAVESVMDQESSN